jgi:exosortase/archaeosortase family protein
MFIAKDFKFKIPTTVKLFLLKISFLFLSWELLYIGFLSPLRIPDAQITNITAAGTASLLSFFYPSDHFESKAEPNEIAFSQKETVYINHFKLIGIADACNALELQVLYVGILVCLQKFSLKTVAFILIGVPIISICNIIRCSIIGWLNITRHLDLSVFAHHYLFKIIMYGLIFFTWVLFTNEKGTYARE